jgi:ubiquinone biosynthesis protein UbiJ
MLNEIVLGTSRHLLAPAQWARSRLGQHAGKQVRIELLLAPAPIVLRIGTDGYLERGDPDATPDLVIRLTPAAAARWLSDREAAWREARVEGDMELAAAVSHVFSNLRWDYEEDLSKLVGDVAAHRLAGGARRLSVWPAEAAESLARAVAEYLGEERHALATPLAVEEFTAEVDELRDAVERLDKRIDRLARRLDETAPG